MSKSLDMQELYVHVSLIYIHNFKTSYIVLKINKF